MRSTLAWLGDYSCSAHFMCPVLKGNVCGNFGITLSNFEKGENKTDVCYENACFLGKIEDSGKIEIELWHSPNAEYEAECFFWCTTDGNLPAPSPNSSQNNALIETLVTSHKNLSTLVNVFSCFRLAEKAICSRFLLTHPTPQTALLYHLSTSMKSH